MSAKDAIDSIASVVALAKERVEMGHKLTHVRQLHENDMMTLERVLEERRVIVRLLEKKGAKRREFDDGYRNNFIEAVRETLGDGT